MNILGTCLQHPWNYWEGGGALRCWHGDAGGLGRDGGAGDRVAAGVGTGLVAAA